LEENIGNVKGKQAKKTQRRRRMKKPIRPTGRLIAEGFSEEDIKAVVNFCNEIVLMFKNLTKAFIGVFRDWYESLTDEEKNALKKRIDKHKGGDE
jgi:hypothetical protein